MALSADAQRTVHRRDRGHRQPHARRRGQFLGTLIHHARAEGCTFAQAQLAIPITVIRTAERRGLMVRPRLLLLRGARGPTTRVVAVALPALTLPAVC